MALVTPMATAANERLSRAADHEIVKPFRGVTHMREGPDDPMVSRDGGLMEAEVDGEMVALHVESGTCFGFNRTAYRIWQLSAQPLRFSELCAALGREFEVDSTICERDVRALLAELSRDGLVTLS
jgi:hypothetical protein